MFGPQQQSMQTAAVRQCCVHVRERVPLLCGLPLFPTKENKAFLPVSSMRGSWWQITTPSRVVRTSNSMTSTPSLTASTNEGIVFPSTCLRRERSRQRRDGRQTRLGKHGKPLYYSSSNTAKHTQKYSPPHSASFRASGKQNAATPKNDTANSLLA